MVNQKNKRTPSEDEKEASPYGAAPSIAPRVYPSFSYPLRYPIPVFWLP
jgi:hypothetical protein